MGNGGKTTDNKGYHYQFVDSYASVTLEGSDINYGDGAINSKYAVLLAQKLAGRNVTLG